MPRPRRIVWLPLALLAVVLAYRPVSFRISLYRLEHADPAAAADRAVEGGDLRLAAVHLFRVHIPAADSIVGWPALEACALRRVGRYTSDVDEGSQNRYNVAALRYAKVFNERLLERTGHCAAKAGA